MAVRGSWPSFHDAEVLELRLLRSEPGDTKRMDEYPVLLLRVQTVWDKICVVTLRFAGVEALELEDFNRQNVLYSLEMTVQPPAAERPARISVCMSTSFGLSGDFTCSSVEVVDATLVGPGSSLSA